MKKYKAGDKIVLEITGINELGSYIFGDITYSWLVSSGFFDKFSEPLSEYTDPLNDKIKRQAAEITRLLRENAELKEKLHEEHHELVWQDGYSHGVSNEAEKWYKNVKIIRDNAFEAGLIRGHEDAWRLAQKIASMKTQEAAECFPEYNFPRSTNGLLNDYTYTEAAAKVDEWERQEIHVGDVVKIHEGNENDICVICISSDKKYYNAIDKYGALYPMLTRETISKTGRHIDVDAWLAQIGGDQNDNR